jgi:phosphatidylglycerophosphatase A
LQKVIFVANNQNKFNQTNLSTMIRQKTELALKKILTSFLAGQYKDMKTVFDTIQKTMENRILSKKDMSQFSKLLSVFFLGQLVDLPTLNRILSYVGITSNNTQKKMRQYVNN